MYALHVLSAHSLVRRMDLQQAFPGEQSLEELIEPQIAASLRKPATHIFRQFTMDKATTVYRRSTGRPMMLWTVKSTYNMTVKAMALRSFLKCISSKLSNHNPVIRILLRISHTWKPKLQCKQPQINIQLYALSRSSNTFICELNYERSFWSPFSHTRAHTFIAHYRSVHSVYAWCEIFAVHFILQELTAF